jgi:hypothetical protein
LFALLVSSHYYLDVAINGNLQELEEEEEEDSE